MKRGRRPSQFALRHVLYNTALAGTAAAAVVAPAHAQRAVALSYQEKPSYARIIAKWADGDEAAPKITAKVDSQVLVVRFDQKVAIDLDALKEGLPSWASIARMDADGMGARIALSKDAKMHLSMSADMVAVDLSSADAPTFPPDIVSPLVAKKAKAAEAARVAALPPPAPLDELEVRGSQSGASSRVGFYWPNPVTYKIVDQKPGSLKILFSRRGKADLAYLHVEPPANLASFDAENTDKGYLATITSKDELPIKVYLDGQVVTVDISKDDPAKAKAVQEIADAAKPQPKPPFAKPLQAKVGDVVASKPAPAPGTLVNSAPAPKTPESKPILLTPPKPLAPVAEPAPAPPAAAIIGGPDHQTALNAAWHDPAPRNGVIDVKVLPLQSGLELQIPFAAPAPAAVFTRGNAVWAVFAANADLRIDPTQLPTGFRVRAQRSKNAAMFRLEIPKGLTVSADAVEATWTIRLAPTGTPPKRFLRPSRRAGDDGRMRIETMLIGAAGIVWIEDPVIGDRIAAAVAYGPSSASQTPRDSFEALMMASAHGLGVAPKSDNVMVTLEGERVAVTFADKGQTTPEAPVAESKAAGAAAPAFIDFARWGGKSGKDWYKRRDELDRKASLADPTAPEGSAALLDLARFYLGHEMAFEALGVLKAASHYRTAVEGDPNFLGMRGAANVMAHRMKAADDDLAKGQLRTDPSAALWRGLVAVNAEDWERANDFFRQSGEQIFAYTPKWAALFAAASAEAALHVNDYDLARRRAEQAVQQGQGEAAERGKMVLANLSAIVDGPAAAYDKFADIALHASEPVAVKAELRRLELGVEAAKMTANDAAAQLESLRFRWRGDDVEMQTVGILADQYMRVGRFREALALAKSTALRDANAPGARDLRIKLSDYFRKLYLDGQADRLDPIQALALFYEFKDLIPIGADGDLMLRKLAQRLVAFDLVEPAAELLQYQIDNRVRGVGRAAIAVDLATIYLRDRRPDRALQAIASSREPQLPKELVLQRRLIEAAAYRDLGRFDHTIELVESLDGVEAKSLLADAYWRDRKWIESARIYSTMMAATDEKTPRRNDIALKAAIAARMAPDAAMLADLRRKWMSLFENDPNKASFDLITAPTDASGAAVSEAARRLADAPRVDAFETAVKKRFEGAGGQVSPAASTSAAAGKAR